MRSLRRVAPVALLLSTCTIGSLAQTPPALSTRHVLVHGHHLAFHVLPGSLPALVLDADGGAHSSNWNSILPEFAKRIGSQIIPYDRAGFEVSGEVPPPYRIENSVTHLESGLTQLGVTHGLVLISHSYAGTIATHFAMRYPDWISGAVLVDTNVPAFFTDEEVTYMGPIIQPMVAEEATLLMKDMVLLAASFYLLKQDLVRAAVSINTEAERQTVMG